uniref:Myblike DNAbinding protein putative n=1 Tax=Albugo laibachii Nc14 TaxID=890382 RepID=F0W765_9STRA|nr:myblike DNAbinding protein putative [Albugo laibachii Nc14]|eukprot:CCA16964.1 myblike DNAbinding protein putative [Albugo laibachii Nc14]
MSMISDSSSKRERDDEEEIQHLTEDGAPLTNTSNRWTSEQDDALRNAIETIGQRNWKTIALYVPGRNHSQCLQRWSKVLKPGLVKGHWSRDEDYVLEKMVRRGSHSWTEVASEIPGRTTKQCRERWRNHLDPSIIKAPFTPAEDEIIQNSYDSIGNRWTHIAKRLPGRTDDAIKARWKQLNPDVKNIAKPGRPRLISSINLNNLRGAGKSEKATTKKVSKDTDNQDRESPERKQNAHLGATFDITSSNPNEEVQQKDAEILAELLLRSSSASSMSLGSIRGLASLNDISPEELLESGELDEMLRSTCLAKSDQYRPTRMSCRLAEIATLNRSNSSFGERRRYCGHGMPDLNQLNALLPSASSLVDAFVGELKMEPDIMHRKEAVKIEMTDLFEDDLLQTIRKGQKLV